MSVVKRLNSIDALNRFNGKHTNHPLVTVLDLSESKPGEPGKIHFELYGIFLKDSKCNAMKYGRNYYDYQDGTLIFVAPEQIVEIEDVDEDGLHQPSGLVLFFHPDLICGTSLGQHIKDYTFFSYQINEALHISEKERLFVLDCFEKIETEIERPIDKHSKKLIANTIELLLNYCVRFYDSQFISREIANKGIVERFEAILDDYFESEKLINKGIPSVAYCADCLNISVKYFGDLIKKETGQSAKDYILNRTIEQAKNRIVQNDMTVNEIAYSLGFKYPQHFSRLFKDKVGYSPSEFKNLN